MADDDPGAQGRDRNAAAAEQLLDLTDYFTEDEVAAFTPAFWEAVSFEGTPYGVPHQTDVSALLVNVPLLTAAGITDIPTTLDEAWTWEEYRLMLPCTPRALASRTDRTERTASGTAEPHAGHRRSRSA